MSSPIRVAIVDDDALVRAGLALILGGADDILVVAEASDGREGIAAARDHRVDVVLMDRGAWQAAVHGVAKNQT